jgi:3-dehydroquinate synthase
MVNLGGGVIGDMGGFCAATYKRGIRFINMPTTLLAQVDASIGGKLGIDFDGFKNHIGMFREPDSVIISTIFMDTLIDREIRSGFAEVVKHALISDSMHFEDISRNLWHKQNWHEVVPHSVTIKENVVIQDPQEQGLRKTLNFGHTIGHAIETHYLNHADNPLLHGEAIAMGMIAETLLSSKKCGLSQDESQSAISYLMDNFPLERIPEKFFDAIINLTIQDKKNRNGKVLSTLLQKIGQCAFDIELSKEELYWAINEYNRKISAK